MTSAERDVEKKKNLVHAV